jgi:hypothetical protein
VSGLNLNQMSAILTRVVSCSNLDQMTVNLDIQVRSLNLFLCNPKTAGIRFHFGSGYSNPPKEDVRFKFGSYFANRNPGDVKFQFDTGSCNPKMMLTVR